MPTYEYECDACGAREEHFQSITEPPKQVCSACGKSALKRVISPAAFVLKGGGWYKDGYASSKSSAKSGTESTSSSSTEKPAGKGTDSGGKKE